MLGDSPNRRLRDIKAILEDQFTTFCTNSAVRDKNTANIIKVWNVIRTGCLYGSSATGRITLLPLILISRVSKLPQSSYAVKPIRLL
jgi:hypothetical protein